MQQLLQDAEDASDKQINRNVLPLGALMQVNGSHYDHTDRDNYRNTQNYRTPKCPQQDYKQILNEIQDTFARLPRFSNSTKQRIIRRWRRWN